MQIEKLVVDSSGSPTTVEITYEKGDKFLDETIDESIKLKVRVSRLPTTNSFAYVGHSVDVLTGGSYTPAFVVISISVGLGVLSIFYFIKKIEPIK